MQTSETITKIAPALIKAQTQMGGAKKGSINPFFKSRYADYAAVLEACKEALNTNGIVILQTHDKGGDGEKFCVVTTLIHESGEFVSSRTPVVCAKQADPQALGSAITYARRYGLQSLVALPADDDDGEGAMERQKPAPQSEPAFDLDAFCKENEEAANALLLKNRFIREGETYKDLSEEGRKNIISKYQNFVDRVNKYKKP